MSRILAAATVRRQSNQPTAKAEKLTTKCISWRKVRSARYNPTRIILHSN